MQNKFKPKMDAAESNGPECYQCRGCGVDSRGYTCAYCNGQGRVESFEQWKSSHPAILLPRRRAMV